MSDFPRRSATVFTVFTEAMLLSHDQRATYLDRTCGDDVDLRRQVEALLESGEKVGDFLEHSPNESLMRDTLRDPCFEKLNDQIGRYKLLQQIGEGGCGVVFLAEQDAPIHRRVALKVIKPGMDTKSVIARFEAERQALALMDHPNIAKVFDAGATDSGRPYFVMELIRGIKITEYCDQIFLPIEERLKLFVLVCQAVQHAHQKGIVHRDIKPSNILVTSTAQSAVMPVVIDFGIAKATTNQRLTDKTVFTAFDMLIGTPAYMSPEQAALTSADVDTRTDIYSLGVLLYELLTGLTPFDSEELLKVGLDEVRKAILEQEPRRPSARLRSMSAADLTAAAECRQSEPAKLIRVISGDLDWIVMKALEKDRTRRYDTANGLALDVQRYLDGEVIWARPPSKLYKFQKTVLRNKLLFAGIGVIVFLLIAGLVVVSSALTKERRSRREAEMSAVESRQVKRFLEDMLKSVGPSIALGQDTSMLRGILDRTALRVGNELTNQPAVHAELSSLIGEVYYELGNYDEAEKMQRAALAIDRRLFGDESKETAASLNDIGVTLCKVGKFAEAETFDGQGLGIRRRLLGNEDPSVADSLGNLAMVYNYQGRLDEGVDLVREALRIRQKRFGPESLPAADSFYTLSIFLAVEGNYVESEYNARHLLAIRTNLLSPEDPLVADALTEVAYVIGYNNKLPEAELLERKALAIRQSVLPVNHPDIAKSFYLVGDRLRQENKFGEANTFLHEALAMQLALPNGKDNPNTLDTLHSIGMTLEAEGKLSDAEIMYSNGLALWRKRGEKDIPQVIWELKDLVRVLVAQKKFSEAAGFLDESLSPAFKKQPSSANLLMLEADLMGRQERWREAAAAAKLALDFQPANPVLCHMIAPLLAITHDQSAYERLCQNIITNFAGTTNAHIADRMAKDCLLLPHSGVDMRTVDKLADIAVNAGNGDPSMPFFQVCKGLSEYRLGHFAEAVSWAEKPMAGSQFYAQSHACAILAMAHWQLGQKSEARTALAKGNTLAPRPIPVDIAQDSGDAWLAWLFSRVSLDEAAALIKPE